MGAVNQCLHELDADRGAVLAGELGGENATEEGAEYLRGFAGEFGEVFGPTDLLEGPQDRFPQVTGSLIGYALDPAACFLSLHVYFRLLLTFDSGCDYFAFKPRFDDGALCTVGAFADVVEGRTERLIELERFHDDRSAFGPAAAFRG